MKLSMICFDHYYHYLMTAHKYNWGGKELCIQVLPNYGNKPFFTMAVLKSPDGNVGLEKPITVTNYVSPDTSSYEKWIESVLNGKKILDELNSIDWKNEFDSLYEEANAKWRVA